MELELKEYLKLLVKWIWLIIIIPILSSALSAYISFFILEPVYEANTTLYVINKSNSSDFPIAYNDLLIGQQLVKDYKEIVKSRRVTSRVIEELGITHLTPSQLAEKISVDSKNETRLIEIKVQDNNPELASDIANKVADVFTGEVVEIMNVENINIVDTAQPPLNPIKPRILMNIAVAFILGLLIAVGLAFVIEYFDDTVKSADDVERYLGLTVLGTIPEFTEN
jgi:capsular polysaccharide biosynthesis protein